MTTKEHVFLKPLATVPGKKEDPKLPGNVVEAIKVASPKRSAAQRATLLSHYFAMAPATAELRKRVDDSRERLSKVEKSIKTMLVTETEKPRMTRILPRGNWLEWENHPFRQPISQPIGGVSPPLPPTLKKSVGAQGNQLLFLLF